MLARALLSTSGAMPRAGRESASPSLQPGCSATWLRGMLARALLSTSGAMPGQACSATRLSGNLVARNARPRVAIDVGSDAPGRQRKRVAICNQVAPQPGCEECSPARCYRRRERCPGQACRQPGCRATWLQRKRVAGSAISLPDDAQAAEGSSATRLLRNLVARNARPRVAIDVGSDAPGRHAAQPGCRATWLQRERVAGSAIQLPDDAQAVERQERV